MVLRLQQASPGGHGETQIPGATPRAFDSVGLAWGLRMCISEEFPGAPGAAVLGLHFEN